MLQCNADIASKHHHPTAIVIACIFLISCCVCLAIECKMLLENHQKWSNQDVWTQNGTQKKETRLIMSMSKVVVHKLDQQTWHCEPILGRLWHRLCQKLKLNKIRKCHHENSPLLIKMTKSHMYVCPRSFNNAEGFNLWKYLTILLFYIARFNMTINDRWMGSSTRTA